MIKGYQDSQKTAQELRKFGLTFSLMFTIIFVFAIPYLKYKTIYIWPAPWPLKLAFAVFVVSILKPKFLSLFEFAFQKTAFVISYINTRVILFLVYFLLIVPVGIILKLRGKDALNRKISKSAETYRVRKEMTSSMENPY